MEENYEQAGDPYDYVVEKTDIIYEQSTGKCETTVEQIASDLISTFD